MPTISQPSRPSDRRDNSTIIHFYWHEQKPNLIRQSFAYQTF